MIIKWNWLELAKSVFMGLFKRKQKQLELNIRIEVAVQTAHTINNNYK